MKEEFTNAELRYLEKVLDDLRGSYYDKIQRYNARPSSEKDIIYKLELEEGLGLLKSLNRKICLEWSVRDDETDEE